MNLYFLENGTKCSDDNPMKMHVDGHPTFVKFTITNSSGRTTDFRMNFSDF